MIISNSKKILIIGGTGFLGKTLRKYWVDDDVYYTSRIQHRNTKCIVLPDVNNKQLLTDIFNRHQFDIVINSATNADPVFNNTNGVDIFHQEINLTSLLIKLAIEHKFKLINISSGVVNHSALLDSGYLEGKRASEFLCNKAKDKADIKIVRLYSVCGEFLNLDSGLAICKFINLAKRGKNLYIESWPIFRSYLFEEDLANSIRNFINSNLYITDIGSCDMITIEDLAETIANFYNVLVETKLSGQFIRNGTDRMIPKPLLPTNTISSIEAIQRTLTFFKNG